MSKVVHEKAWGWEQKRIIMDKEIVAKIIERKAWRDLLRLVTVGKDAEFVFGSPADILSFSVTASQMNKREDCPMRYSLQKKMNEGRVIVTASLK